jgi:endogenous inhibitor of DNA gyrase (YacG/DUF329 family)
LQSVKQVPCPRCGVLSPFVPQNKWRPFCSERCKIVDLGDWASERFRIPVPDENPPDDEPGGGPGSSSSSP